MISINDLISELTQEGFKITITTIRYYIEENLLPRPHKQGGYREGVKLVFPDKDEVLSRIKKIFALKGKGYKLADIKIEIQNEALNRAVEKNKEHLNKIINLNGNPIKKVGKKFINESQNYHTGNNLLDIYERLSRSPVGHKYLSKIKFPQDLVEIEHRLLFQPLYFDGEKPVYLDADVFFQVMPWIDLYRDYGIDWDTLEALKKQNAKNFDKYLFLPEPDGTRFTQEWVNWTRQKLLNRFGQDLLNYFKLIGSGFAKIQNNDEGGYYLNVFWDTKYDSFNDVVSDFLNGKCGFVPKITADNEDTLFYLRRF